MKKQLVLVEALIPDSGASDAHPEHPIYFPCPVPPDLGIWGPDDPRPTPPIFLPVPPTGEGEPPGTWGPNDPRPNPPIYLPVPPPEDLEIWGPNDPRPSPPIYIPVDPPTAENPIELPPWVDISDEDKEKLKDFLLGNLPPYEGPPSVQPV